MNFLGVLIKKIFLNTGSFVYRNPLTFVLSFVVVATVIIQVTNVQVVHAAALTSLSDTLSNPTANATSNHLIIFTTPTGITAGQTVQITFTGYASLPFGTTSLDIKTGASTSSAAQVNVNATNGASQWGMSTSSNVLTLTAPSSGTLPTAGQVVMIYIGTNAVHQASGTQQITNPTAGSYTFSVAGSQADSGSITVNVISNAIVSVSATVAQSLSFSILSATSTAFSNNTFFGTLSSASVKFASATNTAGASGTTTSHVLAISTNAPTGYTITLQGDTLRNQNATATTIAAIGATASTSNAGTPQFGINVTSSGGTGSTINTTYGTTNRYGYNASTSTADLLAYGTVPTTTTTYSLAYMANIPATQAAGTYTTAITYVGTANF